MLRTLLIVCILCAILVFPCSSSCPLPTEDMPVSMCAFCSESTTGIKLMVHSSIDQNLGLWEDVRSIDITFRCHSGTVDNGIYYERDDCFDGTLLPDVRNIAETGVWWWYILEPRLQVGSNCIFTAKYTTITGREISDLRMNTSCSITKKSVSCSNTPDSNCTGDLVPGNGRCSCDCGQGFTTTKISDYEYQYCTLDEDGGAENPSILQEDLSDNSTSCDGTPSGTSTETEQLTTVTTIPDIRNITTDDSSTFSIADVRTTTTDDNSTFSIAGEINSIVIALTTVLTALILSALSVVLFIALNRVRYLRKCENEEKGCERFDPEYNPVAIDKITATKMSLNSMLNSLHNKDTHNITSESISGNLETKSYISDITISFNVLEQTDQIINGEESCTCSQVLCGTNAEPQNTTTKDMITTNKHNQLSSVPASFHPHLNDTSVTTPVYFEFPQCEK